MKVTTSPSFPPTVLHPPLESHYFTRFSSYWSSSPWWRSLLHPISLLLSFMPSVKVTTSPNLTPTVLHPPLEGHYFTQFNSYCPSSPQWKSLFHPVFLLLTFILLHPISPQTNLHPHNQFQPYPVHSPHKYPIPFFSPRLIEKNQKPLRLLVGLVI